MEKAHSEQEGQARPRATQEEKQGEAELHHECRERDDEAQRLVLCEPVGQGVEGGLAGLGGAPDQRAADQELLDIAAARDPVPETGLQLRACRGEYLGNRFERSGLSHAGFLVRRLAAGLRGAPGPGT